MATIENSKRQYELDWLRTFAILILLFFHTARIFDGEPWHIKNAETDARFDLWLAFTHAWRMPLLFFVSGVGSYYATQHRSLPGYVVQRFKRLIIPLIFGVLVILPPQLYYEKIQLFGSYGDVYKSLFNYIPLQNGKLILHHLWFIAYLFIYSLMALPLLWLLRSAGAGRFNSFISRYLSHPASLVLIPGTCMALTQYAFLPDHNFRATFSIYFLFFLFGMILYANPTAREMHRHRKLFLAGTLMLVIVYFWTYLYITSDRSEHFIFMETLHNVTVGYVAWFMVITAVAYGQIYLNKTNRWLPLLNEGIYPFYILHQTVIVALGYYVIRFPWSIGAKFWFISLSTLVICVAIYITLIRPFRVTRFLFGMK